MYGVEVNAFYFPPSGDCPGENFWRVMCDTSCVTHGATSSTLFQRIRLCRCVGLCTRTCRLIADTVRVCRQRRMRLALGRWRRCTYTIDRITWRKLSIRVRV
jgi:hypothetical protein